MRTTKRPPLLHSILKAEKDVAQNQISDVSLLPVTLLLLATNSVVRIKNVQSVSVVLKDRKRSLSRKNDHNAL